VGQVAYRLNLPETSRVHPVFHVSQLKPCLKPGQQVAAQLPPPDAAFQVPVQVLRSRVRQKGVRTVAQVLTQWGGMPEAEATWEDLDDLRRQFPFAPPWGQACFQERGIVSDQSPLDNEGALEPDGQEQAREEARPRRRKRAPGWLATGEWAI
jgi:hypothetical protein